MADEQNKQLDFLQACKDRKIGVTFDKNDNDDTSFEICDKKVRVFYGHERFIYCLICKKILEEIVDENLYDEQIHQFLDSKSWFAGMKIISDKIQKLKNATVKKWCKNRVKKIKEVGNEYTSRGGK